MTTFTSDDREEAYKKIVAEAPNQPGYEDAVPIPFAGWVNTSPPHVVDSGASVMGINAYELADLLEFDAKTLNWKSFSDAAALLRLQANRIKELESKYQQEFKYAENLLKAQDK